MSNEEQNAQFIDTKRRLREARLNEASLRSRLSGAAEELQFVAALLLKFGDGHDLAAHRIRALPSGQQLLGWCTELKETCTRVAQLVEAVHTFEENL